MSEWNHSHPSGTDEPAPRTVADYQNMASTFAGDPPTDDSPAPAGKRKWGLYLAGSLGIVLLGGILFQIFRAEPGEAGPDDAAQGSDNRTGRISPSQVLARVDGYNITWREVADECIARYGRDVLDSIINRTIIQQACAKRNITVTNAEVRNEVTRIAAKFKLTPENWYQMLQAERGIMPIQYNRDIIWPMLALRKIAGTNIKITSDDMRKAFEREYGPRVKAKLIMLDNQRRAIEAHEKAVRNPNDFGRLAQQYSVEPNSKAMWGEIPPIPRHSGNDRIEQEAFRLRKGEVSRVFQVAPSRWVILKCEGRTVPKVTSIDEVKESLYEMLMEEKTQEAVAKVFQKLRREARVDNLLTGTSTGIQQTSGKGSTGSARIRSPYPDLPGTARRKNRLVR